MKEDWEKYKNFMIRVEIVLYFFFRQDKTN